MSSSTNFSSRSRPRPCQQIHRALYMLFALPWHEVLASHLIRSCRDSRHMDIIVCHEIHDAPTGYSPGMMYGLVVQMLGQGQ